MNSSRTMRGARRRPQNHIEPEEEKLKVPQESETTTSAAKDPEEEISKKYRRQLIESQTTSASRVPDKKKIKVRWSLQEEIAKLFNPALEYALVRWEGVSCSISPCPIEDGDYLCTSIMETWPEFRKAGSFRGPTDAGLSFRYNIMLLDTTGMIERCVVSGPGFLMFKLSMKWIAESIHKMIKGGIGTFALKRSVERAILYFLSGHIAEKMHTGHLRSTVIGETLARILEYSGVEVIRRFHQEDDLELKMMTEFLIERFPNAFVNDLSPLELEVLYMKSKEMFDEDAEFRERAQQLQSQGCDERHRIAWAQISKISRERNQNIYERLGIHVKEEVSCFDPFDSNNIKTPYIPRKIESERDEAIRRKFSVDLAALWHALNVVKADWILHVTDVRQRDRFEMFISAAERLGWIVNDGCPYPLSHVGFGVVQADDYERLRTLSTTVVYLVNLLDEAKIRSKAVLVGQGKADEWTAEELEHTAEALGHGAVKYEVLKNNRLTECRINFDEMLNEKGNTVVYLHYTHAQVCSITTNHSRAIKRLKKSKGVDVEELTLKNYEERELGLHLLRFTEVLGEVCTVLMPHILCEYLYDLCKKFDSFYTCVCQVVGYGVVENRKLLLCEATAMVMRKCFHLLGITPIHKKILKLRPGSERIYFSDLTEQQLMELFCDGPCFGFDLCEVALRHNIDASVEIRSSYDKLLLFGIIQAETHISDPSHNGSFIILNRNIDDPLVITKPGSLLSPRDICYCSLSVSTFVKITAKLYGTTYLGGGIESHKDYQKCYPDITDELSSMDDEKVYLNDDAFDVCNGNVLINFSEYFATRPNGGSGSCKLKGKDGYLDLYYVALKYAVEAALEVGFVATCKETKVFGSVMAYYGKNFGYDCCASERSLYNAMLFEIKQPSHIEPGSKINLTRSTLGVPAQYSLIIDAKLHDFTSGDVILSGICEFFVPVDGSCSVGFINGNGCSLKVKVDWKLPIHV
ncbi:Aminoacyl-tRNA synthetase, class 1a, anticodon-binding [Artemisia annua]|uniref:arginine--tRNA ligase n=1 Tax=Artemisia annua TaxID=35608 RepID=A0A2U1QGF9_ARTAN|nr:Aminoacyl-tRNA synthetase, class 1a, anticodon-binding [Artemisia annua]